jgi:hypothetical protein
MLGVPGQAHGGAGQGARRWRSPKVSRLPAPTPASRTSPAGPHLAPGGSINWSFHPALRPC